MDIVRIIKRQARRTPIYAWRVQRGLKHELQRWKDNGAQLPLPRLLKQQVVLEYGKRFEIPVLIETGTYRGDMVYACRNAFRQIHSIEVDRALFVRARERFAHLRHVYVHCGDSSCVLPALLAAISERCLFWLDGHYSGEGTGQGRCPTPIVDELESILNHAVDGHVVLIDDARLFTGRVGYPRLEELTERIRTARPTWTVTVRDDIIRAHGPL